MPDARGFLSNEEIDQLASKWETAPGVGEFPAAETQRIKDDPATLGWIETPLGEVYLGADLIFFSLSHPMGSDLLNSLFRNPLLRYSPAYGDQSAYYLSTASGWLKYPYWMRRDDSSGFTVDSDDTGTIY